jgi:hypothetical protein
MGLGWDMVGNESEGENVQAEVGVDRGFKDGVFRQ